MLLYAGSRIECRKRKIAFKRQRTAWSNEAAYGYLLCFYLCSKAEFQLESFIITWLEGKLYLCGQHSFAIPLLKYTMRTNKSSDVDRHIARCTLLVPIVQQCELVSVWGLRKWRSVLHCGSRGSEKSLLFDWNTAICG